MKRIYFFMAVAAISASAHAAPVNTVETLPNSNELNQTVVKSTSIAPAAVAVSSSAASRVDTLVASKMTTAMGAAYQRAEVIVQNVGTVNVWCGPSLTETALAGGAYKIAPDDTWVFKVGKKDTINCISETSAGALRVGGEGWK